MSYDFMQLVDSMDPDQFSAAFAYMIWQASKREIEGEQVIAGTYDQMAILQMISEERKCAH